MGWIKVTECLEVNEAGEVRSIERKVKTKGGKHRLSRSKILSQRVGTNGYKVIVTRCHGEGKTINIHRLVAKIFVPNPNNYPQVNHKDGNKQNNHYTNLEWVTQSQNQRHAYSTGLQNIKYKIDKNAQKIIAILAPHIPLSSEEIGKLLGVSSTSIMEYIKNSLRESND